MKQLEAYEVPLAKVFSSDYSFRIPDYQRPYAWGTEETGQLLDDLVDALDRSRDEPYFLGSVVLVKEKASSDAEVIDGQQRLTTLTILLAVLRDLTTTPKLSDEIDGMLVEPGNIVQGLPERPRLTLRRRDADFFMKYVQEAGHLEALSGLPPDALPTDAQRAVRENASSLRQRLEEWPEERRLDLVKMLGRRTYLVVVATPDLESAHRIFSVMNARGLDLSPADIFKARVIGAIEDGASEDYARKWEDAEEDLGRDDFADVFLHVRMVYAKERAKRELLKEFPEQVLNLYVPDRPKEFVDEVLVPYADAYEITRDASYSAVSGADTVNRWLRRLAQLDNNDWRPPAMWGLHHHGDDPAWLDAFFGRLERLAASMLVRRVYATPRASRYAQVLTELDQGQGPEASALDLTEEEGKETAARLAGEVYLAQKVRRYVLLRLDQELARDPGAEYTHRIITVEHVLPQSPAASSEWVATFTNEQREYWTHRLANLVLLNRTKNSEAQNFDFALKKDKYFKGKSGVSTFALTSQVLGEPDWTPAVLDRRQQELLTVLRSAWKLPKP